QYFANCYHFLIDILVSKGIGNVNGILMPIFCVWGDEKLRKKIFGGISKFFQLFCPFCTKNSKETKTPDVLTKLIEKPASEEANERILELESTWDKAFEMHLIRK